MRRHKITGLGYIWSVNDYTTEELAIRMACLRRGMAQTSASLIDCASFLGRGNSGPSQRAPKSGRSSSLDGDHHDGFHRDEAFGGGPAGGSNPSRGGRSGSNWGRGNNMNSGQSRRGASRGGGRGR